MLKKMKEFVKKEMVLCVAAVCAVGTMFLVPPDSTYWSYIDLRVLCLLLCLMAVVDGFRACGAFRWLTFELLRSVRGGRALGVTLVLLPFFCSMLVTNDVALLVFVPFTMLLLEQLGCAGRMIPVLVLQTVAANLGSMATPVGNPQNLFLYAFYGLSAGEFFAVTLPVVGISLVCLSVAAFPVLPKSLPEAELEESLRVGKRLPVYGGLFLICLLTVFQVIHFGVMTVIVLTAIAVMDRKQLKELDFALLATFVCFFIVSGNLGRVEIVRSFLEKLLAQNTLLTAVGASQVISNVPAAVLLSGFADQWRELLEGVNIGGLGTPVASLASLITLKLYLRRPDAQGLKFLGAFTLVNVIGLVLLLGTVMLY